ncbi:MAG: hypothetical protein ACRD97_06680 [Nitrososphaeraceae archaeon]
MKVLQPEAEIKKLMLSIVENAHGNNSHIVIEAINKQIESLSGSLMGEEE